MNLYGQLLYNVKQFIPQVNMAPGLARNARGPRLLTMGDFTWYQSSYNSN